MKKNLLSLAIALLALAGSNATAADQDAINAKVDAMLTQLKTWAGDPVLVKAVKDHNASLPADCAAMTEEKWKGLTILDPFVRGFSKNEAGAFLKSKKGEVVSEAFVCDAAGFKVAFLSKTTSWCHKGSAKHDQPMAGKTWRGQVEVDDSSGLQQIQVSVPVLDGDKPIGSLVVGLSIDKLLRN